VYDKVESSIRLANFARGALAALDEDDRLKTARILTRRTVSLIGELREDTATFETTAKWISMLGEAVGCPSEL
jgi:hypothetical protein